MRIRGPQRTEAAEEWLVEQITGLSHTLDTTADLDPLIDRIGDANFVLIGEASHGTSDFYVWRALLSQRLIQEKGLYIRRKQSAMATMFPPCCLAAMMHSCISSRARRWLRCTWS